MSDDYLDIDGTGLPDDVRRVAMPDATIEDQWHMMRELTIEAYVKMGIDITKQSMRKDVVRLSRLKDQ